MYPNHVFGVHPAFALAYHPTAVIVVPLSCPRRAALSELTKGACGGRPLAA